ncbi:protein kinase domain-containing protein [Trujillonella endophytica]|uniref:protein kinase domain-containing protein n=1 Tax=Trujillonella endophytica TaxID=673521 RepID=UPI001FCCFE25|nr:protein kinase [Trujillella endophytica]
MSTGEGERRLLGGRYALEERIATGGMGEVWRGRDVVLQRAVAVKVLRSEFADDPTFIQRFRAEARNAASLSHPNIAAVLDYGEASPDEAGEHLAYLVMELVDGAPLSARLSADGPMEPQAALSVLRQTAAGLAEAHRHGVVHRDVKPANILVRADGAVKLTDFGIARSTDSVHLTRTGQVIGTAQYMSPEQAKGEPATPASDVYALGLVGYESLTGHAAFAGDNPVTVALKHVVEDPEPLPADLPHEVRDLIDSALVKDPQDRVPDGGAFLDAVQETLDHGQAPGGTAAYTRPVRVLAGASALRAPGTQQGRRALSVLLPLLALLLVAGSLAFVLGGGGGGGGGDEDTVAQGPSAAADQGVLLAAADHVGREYEDVAGELGSLGLDVVRVDEVTAEHPAGTVLAVSPVGTRLDEGDEVRVTVAVAPAEEALPEASDAPAGPAGQQVVVGTGSPAAGSAEAPSGGPGTTAPGTTAPTGPGVPGATPSDPATTPIDPGSTPSDPGTTPADPGTSAPSGTPSEPAPSQPTPAEPTASEPAPTEPTEPPAPEPGPTGTVDADTAPEGVVGAG